MSLQQGRKPLLAQLAQLLTLIAVHRGPNVDGCRPALRYFGEDIGQLKESLGGITGGLSTAFETTLITLVAALIVQMRMTFIQQKEAVFLDECNDYCQAFVVSRGVFLSTKDAVGFVVLVVWLVTCMATYKWFITDPTTEVSVFGINFQY